MKRLTAVSALALMLHAEASLAPAIERFLAERFRFSRGDLAALRDDRAVIQTLPSSDPREIASVGAIRIDVAPADYIERLRDIAAFKRGDSVTQIGTFSIPPAAEDLEQLTLPDEDRRDLATCRPGRCDVQLPAGAIERIVQSVEWKTPRATEQADRAFRAELVRIARNYLELGEGGMPLYHDTAITMSMAVEFRSMVWDEPALLSEFDSLSEHLRRFPKPSPGVDDVLYWSRERIGNAEVISMTHLAIQAVSDRSPVAFIAASRQVYSTHYFDASLGLTVLLAESAGADSAVVVYANRSRVDVFGGLLGPMKRAIAASRSRAAMTKFLTGIRQKVERQDRAVIRSKSTHAILLRYEGAAH